MKKTLLLIAIIASFSLVSDAQCSGNTPEQRRAFADLPSDRKVALWRDHLQEQLDTRRLTGQQRGLIVAGLNLLTEKQYETPIESKSDTGRAYAAWREQLELHFSQQEGREIFQTLPRFTEAKLNLVVDCNCSTWWTWCPDGMSCSTSCSQCTDCTRIISCGPFWGFQCNGLCWVSTESLQDPKQK